MRKLSSKFSVVKTFWPCVPCSRLRMGRLLQRCCAVAVNISSASLSVLCAVQLKGQQAAPSSASSISRLPAWGLNCSCTYRLFNRISASTMAEKRSRDGECSPHPLIPPPPPRIPPPPPQQWAAESGLKINAGEALPTLTNWGGGQKEGKVLSNARLTSHQRSTVQRAVCTYFLENKFEPCSIFAARSSRSRTHFHPHRCRKGADCPFSHDAVVPQQKEMCAS